MRLLMVLCSVSMMAAAAHGQPTKQPSDAAATQAATQKAKGYFKGEVVASFLADGRNMRLERPFGYVDPEGLAWDVPSGAETDGASVPQFFWVSHPPFTGQYRVAAVVHDYYCQVKQRSWRQTHKVFYDAMLSAGVSEATAKAMYGAVYYFGPRWGARGNAPGPGTRSFKSQSEQSGFFEKFDRWVKEKNPSLSEISQRLESGQLDF